MDKKEPFVEPTPSVTPEQRRKFHFLVGFAVLILILVWIAALPFNYRSRGDTEEETRSISQGILEPLRSGGNAIGSLTRSISDALRN